MLMGIVICLTGQIDLNNITRTSGYYAKFPCILANNDTLKSIRARLLNNRDNIHVNIIDCKVFSHLIYGVPWMLGSG